MDIAGLDPSTLADSVKPLLDWRDLPVDLASLAALAAGLGWASGLRLYALVFVLGALARFAGVQLPGGLGVLAHPLVLGVSALVFRCFERPMTRLRERFTRHVPAGPFAAPALGARDP